MAILTKIYSCTTIQAGKKVTLKSYWRGLKVFEDKNQPEIKLHPGEATLTDWYFQHEQYTRKIKERVDGLFWSNINLHSPKTSPKFTTFTFKENEKDIKKAWDGFEFFMKRFNRYASKHLGVKKLAYLTTLEFQNGERKKELQEVYKKKGLDFYSIDHMGCIHFHTVFFNLPFIDKEKLAELWGNGFVNIQSCRAGQTGKREGEMLSELVKYVTCTDFDVRIRGQKIFSSSKNLNKPIKLHHEKSVSQPDTSKYRVSKSVLYESPHIGEIVKTDFYCERITKGLRFDDPSRRIFNDADRADLAQAIADDFKEN